MFSKNNFKYIRILQILLKMPRHLRASAPKHTQHHRYDVGQLQQERTLTSHATRLVNGVYMHFYEIFFFEILKNLYFFLNFMF